MRRPGAERHPGGQPLHERVRPPPVLGASFSNHTGITPKKPTIQVDQERTALGRTFPVDVPLWGEIGVTVERLLEALAEGAVAAEDQRPEIAARWGIWRQETSLVNPDYAAFARSCGGLGIRVQDPELLDAAFREALDFQGPSLLEIHTDALLP